MKLDLDEWPRQKGVGPPTRCRPVRRNGYEREFVYADGAVGPREGDFDWKMCPQMNTQRMSEFLVQVSERFPRDFIIRVVDGASSHRAKDLLVPENIKLLSLPAYSPELNPPEHIGDERREKEFPNRVFDSRDGVKKQLRSGSARLQRDYSRVKSITGWPSIVTLNLKAP